MNNPMLNMAMNMLQMKNPQRFQQVNQMMQANTDPRGFLKQIMGNASPEQIQNVMQVGKQFGVPDSVLSQIQNMK
jgi:hypothetical protein